ncbi:S9 family peptidase [Candidatus Bathyarchaeota archaeon]|nr:S9 family peptidase [Candidatus Bathyarchaeota archaeon]
MAPRNIEIKDLRKFVFISDPQTSPDGSRVAYVQTSVDYEDDGYIKHIWVHKVASGKNIQFTHGKGKHSFPRWSPDGDRLLFLASGRKPESKTQLYVIDINGGEAGLVADLETGVSNPKWSPDGKAILFSSRTWEPEKPGSDVVVVKRIRFKLNGVGMFAGKRLHLFTVKTRGGKPKQVTKGEYDVAAYSWSPDGKEISYATNLGDDQDTSYIRDIYVVPAKGGEACVVTNSVHTIYDISWSEHGLAYLGHDFHAQGATNTDIWVKESLDSEPVNITEGFNRRVGGGIGSDLRFSTPGPGAVWGPKGEHIYFMAGDIPHSNIYRVKRASHEVEQMTEGITVDGFSYSADCEVLSYNTMNAVEPCELYVNGKKVTKVNERHLKNLRLSTPEMYIWNNELGDKIHGWVMKPQDYVEGEIYPTIVQIHGGPLGIYGDGIYQEFQLMAASGFCVIYTNPRGSAGYGEEYGATLNGRHGTVDHIDIMDFTRDAIKRFPFIDSDRLGVTGGSYGGYLTNWIVTQTDMFRAGVACRSTCNRYSHHGYSDLGFNHGPSGNMGYPWRDEDKLLSQSPLRYAKNVKTPLLFIHSENDLRCPVQQAEEFFVALMELGVDTELVRFPDENHELSRSGKPKHREERFRHIIRWFNRYLK